MDQNPLYRICEILKQHPKPDLASYLDCYTGDGLNIFDGYVTGPEESYRQTAPFCPAEAVYFNAEWVDGNRQGGLMLAKYPEFKVEGRYCAYIIGGKIHTLIIDQDMTIKGRIVQLGKKELGGKEYHQIDIIKTISGNRMRLYYPVGLPAAALALNNTITVSSFELDGLAPNNRHLFNVIYAIHLMSTAEVLK